MARKKAETAQEAPATAPASTTEAIEPRILNMPPAYEPVAALVPLAPPSPEEVLKLADNQIKIRKGYVALVSKFLRPEDVLVFGDNVYLPAKPCQDILSWARIRVKPHWPIEEHHYNSPDGEFIEFVITATITDSGGREVDVMGNRSTRDEFFGISGKDYVCPTCKGPTARRKAYPSDKWDSNFCDIGKHGKVKAEAIVHYLPLCDVDIPSVRKAAVTNLWNSALKAIGLMPTLQDLEEAGMNIAKVTRVDFKKSSEKPPPKQAAAPPPPTNVAPASAPPPPPPSSAPATGPTKAVIPPQNWGNVQGFKKLKTGGGQDYGIVTMNGVNLFVFDNKALEVGGTRKYTVFELLDMAAVDHWICTFTIEGYTAKKSGKSGWRIVGARKIGIYEWDDDGMPVIRREAQPSAPADSGYQATDDDFPEEMFP